MCLEINEVYVMVIAGVCLLVYMYVSVSVYVF